jgi:hypothetical protein
VSGVRLKATKATWAELGLNPFTRALLLLQALVLIADVGLFLHLGLSLEWSAQATVAVVCLGLAGGLWVNFYLTPCTPNDRFAAEVVFAACLLMTFTFVASPGQYAAVALGLPYADGWLAAADAKLGIDVSALAEWTRGHDVLARIMTWSYLSLAPQLLIALLGLAALRRRERLWELVFHIHVCLAIVLAALVVWPAVCPPAHFGFTPTIGMTHLIAQIKGFHEGTMTVVRSNELEGLVSFPSFHVAAGLIVVWSFRGYPRTQLALAVLNVAMIVSTFMTGVHYVIDVIAAAPLFGISLAAYRGWGRRLLVPPPR